MCGFRTRTPLFQNDVPPAVRARICPDRARIRLSCIRPDRARICPDRARIRLSRIRPDRAPYPSRPGPYLSSPVSVRRWSFRGGGGCLIAITVRRLRCEVRTKHSATVPGSDTSDKLREQCYVWVSVQ